jgi:hypothetical protein
MNSKSPRTAFPVIAFLILSSTSCKSKAQSEAVQQAKAIQSELKKTQPAGIPTTEGGWTMTAKIDGKPWSANSMISPARAGQIVGQTNDGESISLPYYDLKSLLAYTQPQKLGGTHDAVDMSLNDDIGLWSAKTGTMQLTKVDDNWAEGKFSFTAAGFQSNKTLEVTDGFFRISMARQYHH